jgi:hypothetical protein
MTHVFAPTHQISFPLLYWDLPLREEHEAPLLILVERLQKEVAEGPVPDPSASSCCPVLSWRPRSPRLNPPMDEREAVLDGDLEAKMRRLSLAEATLAMLATYQKEESGGRGAEPSVRPLDLAPAQASPGSS